MLAFLASPDRNGNKKCFQYLKAFFIVLKSRKMDGQNALTFPLLKLDD